MLGPSKTRCLDRPVLVSLEGLVPAGHFYRHRDAALDLGFVRDRVAGCYTTSSTRAVGSWRWLVRGARALVADPAAPAAAEGTLSTITQ